MSNRIDIVIDRYATTAFHKMKKDLKATLDPYISMIGSVEQDISGRIVHIGHHRPDNEILELLAEIYLVDKITVEFHPDPQRDGYDDNSHYTLQFGTSYAKAIANMKTQLRVMQEKYQQTMPF